MRAEEARVLVVAPVGHDAEAMAALLRAEGVQAEACAGVGGCLERMESGAGAVLLTEEALELPGAEQLLEGFRRQPAWSELPLIILTSGGDSRYARLLEIAAEVAGAVTLLERPMRTGTLLQSVRVALRSRRRQYEVRNLLAERERREAALRESERRLRTFFTSEMMGALYWNIDGRITGANDRFLQMVGYTREDLVSGRVNWARMTPPEYASLDQRALEELRTKGVDTPYEKEFIRKGGTRVPVFIGAAMLDDDRSEGVAFVLDITERKRAEEALRRNERRQRYLLKLSDALRGVADAVQAQGLAASVLGEELAANRVVYFEVGPEDYLVEQDYTNGVPQLRGKFPIASFGLSLAEAYRAGRTVVVNDVGNDPGLSPAERARYAAIHVGAHVGVPLVKEGRLVAGLGVHSSHSRDWTADDVELVEQTAERTWAAVERARAEKALRRSEDQFRSIADTTPVLMWMTDARGKVEFVNRTYREFFGVTLEQVTGPQGWQPLVHPADAETYVRAHAEALEHRREFRAEARVRRVDGEWRWVESYAAPRFSRGGEFLGMAGSSPDITERKAFQAELERLVAERTAALRELVGELEHFSYSITHDMRAPLRAMMGFAEVAKELCPGDERPEQKMFLDRIQTAAKRMDLLITDALNYSRAVRSELPLAPVDVGRLLRGMLDTYPELQVAQGGVRIDPELPLVMGNEAGLTQCFSNLLGNAVKFAKPGEAPEVRVWAEIIQTPQSAVQGQDGDGWVRIWVEDRGIGIRPNMLPRVFDMFARGASDQAGTGIGLALVRKVTERMGGRVGVDSQQGEGSRFWVELRPGETRRRAGG